MLTAALLSGAAWGSDAEHARILREVAKAIEALKPDYPQLAGFSASAHLEPATPAISYGYHTHRIRGAGWTAGVPNPDADGVWFYIDLHERDSTLQIHTQPADPVPSCIGEKRVSFLILEGAATRQVGGAIGAILLKHGMKPCGAG